MNEMKMSVGLIKDFNKQREKGWKGSKRRGRKMRKVQIQEFREQ